MTPKKGIFHGFGRNVYAAGFVSLFMDISSEMVYSLVPLFLANSLGVNKSIIGFIEGVAESTASVLRAFSGYISDRMGTRKWVMAAGYGISVLSRPLIAMGNNWGEVMVYRFTDRFGKGVRSAPRDAIIAESTHHDSFARAFNFHRAMDTFGAVLGPLIAFILLAAYKENYRLVFWLSIIPGVIAVALIIIFIQDVPVPAHVREKKLELSVKRFDWKFRLFLLIAALFALGNVSDFFLILRAQDVGIPVATIPVVYLFFNLIYSLFAIPAGIMADTYGKKRLILVGMALFALLFLGFAQAQSPRAIWFLFALYGIFMGLTEGIQKAYLATIIPAEYKATAYGIFNSAVGIAMLPSGIIAGWLWDAYSPAATFYFGAATATLSALAFAVYSGWVDREKALRQHRPGAVQ